MFLQFNFQLLGTPSKKLFHSLVGNFLAQAAQVKSVCKLAYKKKGVDYKHASR